MVDSAQVAQRKARIVSLVDEVILFVTALVTSHGLRPTNDSEVAIICLYFSLIECAKSSVVLSRHGCEFSIPPVSRTAFEAFIDLCQLDSEPHKIHNLEAKRLLQKKTAMTAALKMQKGQKGDSGERIFHRAIEEANKNLKSLAPGQRSVEKRSDLIRKIDQHGVIEFLYVELCDWSHNNTNVLRQKHLIERESGSQFVVFRQLEVDFFESLFATVVLFINSATPSVLRLLAADDAAKNSAREWLSIKYRDVENLLR